jgi:hypothetical protein
MNRYYFEYYKNLSWGELAAIGYYCIGDNTLMDDFLITIVWTVLPRDHPEITKHLIMGRGFNRTQVETEVGRNAFNE